MTIDEAISHALEVAEQNETQADKWQEEGGEQWGKTTACRECAADHRQLAEWLTELKELKNSIGAIKLSNMNEALELIREYKAENIAQKKMIAEYKRILKMAVEDFKQINSDILTCKYCKWYSAETDECAYYPDDTPCEQICGWKHEGEALKLMGETNDEP